MAKLPTGRAGSRVLVKKRPLPFSFWPMYKGSRRFGLQSTLFVLDPWTVIRDSLNGRCPTKARAEAVACLEQAKDFYLSAMLANVAAARPLQLYYCFMNLAKALALCFGNASTFDTARHGLAERLAPKGRELIDAYLEAYPSPPAGTPNVFDHFLGTVTNKGLAAAVRFDLKALLPQVLPGHRLWAGAANATERFISAHDIRFCEDKTAKKLWLAVYFFADDLSRLNVTRTRLLEESRLGTKFREVKCSEEAGGRRLICFEQLKPLKYTARSADAIPSLVSEVRPYLWVTVGASPPYRRYYVYLAPSGEHPMVLPQLLSVYAITFYLGSITRYRPQQFDSILTGSFGSRIEEFITGQPSQFVYLIASEFARQEVTQPSIV